MPYDSSKLLDATNLAILRELQQDARLSYSELSRRVGLSVPAVTERVRRLEDAGIIEGYGVRLNFEALGYGITALIELSAPPSRYPQVLAFCEQTPEIRESYFVTGDSSYVMRVVARSVQHLQEIIQRLGTFGSTRTSVVLSSPIIKTSFDLENLKR